MGLPRDRFERGVLQLEPPLGKTGSLAGCRENAVLTFPSNLLHGFHYTPPLFQREIGINRQREAPAVGVLRIRKIALSISVGLLVVRVQMKRNEVNAGSHVCFLETLYELCPAQSIEPCSEANDKQVPGVLGFRSLLWRHFKLIQPRQPRRVKLCHFASCIAKLIRLLELSDSERALHVG